MFKSAVYLVKSRRDSGIGLERAPGGGRPSRVDHGYIRDAVIASSMTSSLHPPARDLVQREKSRMVGPFRRNDLNPVDFGLRDLPAPGVQGLPRPPPQCSSAPGLGQRALGAIIPEYIQNVCRSFPRRVEAVIAADGGHI